MTHYAPNRGATDQSSRPHLFAPIRHPSGDEDHGTKTRTASVQMPCRSTVAPPCGGQSALTRGGPARKEPVGMLRLWTDRSEESRCGQGRWSPPHDCSAPSSSRCSPHPCSAREPRPCSATSVSSEQPSSPPSGAPSLPRAPRDRGAGPGCGCRSAPVAGPPDSWSGPTTSWCSIATPSLAGGRRVPGLPGGGGGRPRHLAGDPEPPARGPGPRRPGRCHHRSVAAGAVLGRSAGLGHRERRARAAVRAVPGLPGRGPRARHARADRVLPRGCHRAHDPDGPEPRGRRAGAGRQRLRLRGEHRPLQLGRPDQRRVGGRLPLRGRLRLDRTTDRRPGRRTHRPRRHLGQRRDLRRPGGRAAAGAAVPAADRGRSGAVGGPPGQAGVAGRRPVPRAAPGRPGAHPPGPRDGRQPTAARRAGSPPGTSSGTRRCTTHSPVWPTGCCSRTGWSAH